MSSMASNVSYLGGEDLLRLAVRMLFNMHVVYSCLFPQILQSIANHVLFTKEEHMRPFNDFVKSNFDSARR